MSCHVLILCTHNSARSVLAEGMLNHWAARLQCDVRGHSAGSAPSGRVHPLAIATLHDAGIATRGLRSKSWDEFTTASAPPLSVVITVCDHARQAIGFRMLQLLDLLRPAASAPLSRAERQAAVLAIGRS